LYFDNNDKASYGSFNNYFNTEYIKYLIKNDLKCFLHLWLLKRQYRAFGIWNFHLKHLESDGMIYLCDDTELFPDTLKNLFEVFINKFPDTDGIVTLNQSNIEGSDSAMGLIGRKFAERYLNNQCFCPDYVSFFADAELGNYAKKLGKFHWADNAKLIHYHPAFYKNKIDEAHRIVRDNNQVIDKKVNQERVKNGILWGESFKLIGRGLFK